jgi:hypothetical protein
VPVTLEPVSPELVLVDPELRSRLRTTGPAADCLAPRPRPAPAPPAAEARTGFRLWNGLLLLSLLANAIFLASAWTGGQKAHSPAPPTKLGATGATGSIGSAASSVVRSRPGGAFFVPQTPPP